jgi:hypothetical protein
MKGNNISTNHHQAVGWVKNSFRKIIIYQIFRPKVVVLLGVDKKGKF